MVDVVVPQGIVEGISQELQKGPLKGIPKEYQRKPTQSVKGRNLKVISKEPQRSSTGTTKETANNLRNSEDAGTRGHRQSLLRPQKGNLYFQGILWESPRRDIADGFREPPRDMLAH